MSAAPTTPAPARPPQPSDATHPEPERAPGGPRWFIAATAAMAIAILAMAIAETNIWMQFLVDRGEWLCLAGLAFAAVAGLSLHRTDRLAGSLPLFLPWLIYPVVTQGDQIIDNLGIDAMRVVCHVILAVLFAAPVAVLVTAARRGLAPRAGKRRPRLWTALLPGLRLIERGEVRLGGALFALTLLLVEIEVAYRFLGELMVITLVVMGIGYLFVTGSGVGAGSDGSGTHASRERKRRRALVLFLVSLLVSLGLYLGYKNRPGAYQGSPHFFHDPSQKEAVYAVDRIAAPAAPPRALSPELSQDVGSILADYARALEELVGAYYVLDRSYNYSFHNALFLRSTPVQPDFRATSLARIDAVRTLVRSADARLPAVMAALPAGDGLRAFLQEVQAYLRYNLGRAALLEEMSERFERTQAGLQHATHLYEGEGKVVGEQLARVIEKHRIALEAPAVTSTVAPFVTASHRIQKTYASRIVGF